MTFNLQPSLQGKLLALRPLRHEDWEELYQCASDPLIWEQHPQSTRYQRDVFRTFFDGAIRSQGAFAAIDNASGRIVGSSRYYDHKAEQSQVTIGYTFLARQYWGGLYNREMKGLMLRHAFAHVENVLFEIGESNLRSRTAIERLGATLIRKETLDDKSHVIYRITRGDPGSDPC